MVLQQNTVLAANPSLRRLAIALARALRRAGAPAHRVEDRMAEFARTTGADLAFHVLPGAILASVGSETTVIDVSPGPPDLDRLTALEELAERAATGTLSYADALAMVTARESAPGRYGPAPTLLAYTVASASGVSFFGGGAIEVVLAATVGLLSGAIALALAKRSHAAHLVEVAAATLGAFLVAAVAHQVPVAGQVALITGLIVLMPGFTLTTALTELATGHRISGTAGLAAGGLILMELGFGTALGSQLAEALFGPTTWAQPAIPLPWGWGALALIGVALAFGVLLQAQPRHLPQVLAASALAIGASRLASPALGPELGGGVAAVVVTLAANAMSRRLNQPAAVWQLPGILLLVPGSIGYRSVTALLEHDVLGGVEGAFGTALAAMALVGGSLLGSALVPPRRAS